MADVDTSAAAVERSIDRVTRLHGAETFGADEPRYVLRQPSSLADLAAIARALLSERDAARKMIADMLSGDGAWAPNEVLARAIKAEAERDAAQAAAADARREALEEAARVALTFPVPDQASSAEMHGRNMSALGIAAAIRALAGEAAQ